MVILPPVLFGEFVCFWSWDACSFLKGNKVTVFAYLSLCGETLVDLVSYHSSLNCIFSYLFYLDIFTRKTFFLTVNCCISHVFYLGR